MQETICGCWDPTPSERVLAANNRDQATAPSTHESIRQADQSREQTLHSSGSPHHAGPHTPQ